MEPLHKGRRARRTPHSRPLTFTSQQKRSRGRGRGRDKTACWTAGDRGSTDELGGVGKQSGGGVGLSDPIQHAQKKSRPKPLRWTRVAMATPLPSGTRSAGNQLTESVYGMDVGGDVGGDERYVIFTGANRRHVKLSFSFLRLGRTRTPHVGFRRSPSFTGLSTRARARSARPEAGLRGCCHAGPTRLHLRMVLLPE